MSRLRPVAVLLLALALLVPGVALGGHPCCHPGVPCARCAGLPPGGPPCGETGVEHGCHCRVTPEKQAPATGADDHPEGRPVASAPGALPPRAFPPTGAAGAARRERLLATRAGPGTLLFLATGRFLS